MNKLKIFLLIILPFISSCDFRIPQDWENPSWIFELSIPLINETYPLSTIASESNNIEITPDTSNFIIELKEEIIHEGDVVTDESFFIIPSSEINFSLDEITVPNPNPMPEIPTFSQTILISDFITTEDFPSLCLPLNVLEDDIEETQQIDIDSFCEDIGDVQCLNAINFLKIGEGSSTLSINNNLPFKISELELNISSNGEEFINHHLFNIEGEEIRTSDLFDKNLGCEIEGSVYFKIDQNLQINSGFEECNVYEFGCEAFGNEEGYDTIWENDECLIQITLNQVFCKQAGYQWDGDQCIQILPPNTQEECNLIPNAHWNEEGQDCYYIIEITQDICESEEMNGSWTNDECYLSCENIEACCNAIDGQWDGNECSNLPLSDGVLFSGDESLTISNEMEIDNFESLNVDIECLIETSYTLELPINPNIDLIEGHISDLEDLETNRIRLDLTNNFFSDMLFNLHSNNLFDSNNDTLNNTQLVNQGESLEDIILSDYTIKNNNGGPVDLLSIGFSVALDEDSATIDFDESYGLSGEGVEQKTIELDALKVHLNEFSTSDIDMGSVPSGFEGFDIPFLSFNLYLYNQISADMSLYLDLIGVTDDDTLTIHVEPNIKFLDLLEDEDPVFFDTDSLIISFFQDTMSVEHIGNDLVHDAPVIDTMGYKITDLFSYDQIYVSGYAVMDGDASLFPDRSLWGDIEIIINPLTIIIEDEFSFVSNDFTELSIMDEQIATKIDSGLVSATINMNLNNSIPFGGNLLIYISNHPDYFPLCIDSLQSGSIDIQSISDSCMIGIQNYLQCDTIDIIYDSLNFVVNHMDCIGETDYYYQNLLNLDFYIPDLDQWGNVVDTISTQQEIVLEDEIYYFTRQNEQYLIPRFVFDNELDTITLQPSNSLNINSYIIFKLLTSGLLE